MSLVAKENGVFTLQNILKIYLVDILDELVFCPAS
jgi:hypothetical protein